MKDAFGDTLKVGDTVVYAVRSGSSLHMRKGKIKRFAMRKETWTDKDIEKAIVDAERNDYGCHETYETTIATPRSIVRMK